MSKWIDGHENWDIRYDSQHNIHVHSMRWILYHESKSHNEEAKVTMKNYESPRGSRLNLLPVRRSSMPPLIVQAKPKVLLLSLATEN